MINDRPVDDPKLQAALNEIRDIMERRGFPGAVMLVGEDEAVFSYKMDAEWSAFRKDRSTPLGFRLRIREAIIGRKEAERRATGACHTACQLSDFGAQTMDWMEQLKSFIRKAGIDFEHVPFNGRPLPSIQLPP